MTAPKIEIVSTEVRRMSGTSAKGKPYDLAFQEGYMHNGGRYPDKCEIPVPKNDQGAFLPPYAAGWYEIAAGSYEVRDGRPSINSFELRLVASESPDDGKAGKKGTVM